MSWTLLNSDTTTFADGNAGHVYTPAFGAGQLDVLCVNSDTTVSTPVTSGGAAWTLGPTFVGNQGAYIWYRIATGGEGSTITVTTTGNFPTQVSLSSWSAGTITADQNAVAHIDGTDGNGTPVATTAALAVTGELSVAFGAIHSLDGGTATSPVWATGYTALTFVASGITAADVAAFTGYNSNAGTAAESADVVSWTGASSNAHNRYTLIQTFEASGTSAPAGAAGGSAAGNDAVSGVSLGMTIQGH